MRSVPGTAALWICVGVLGQTAAWTSADIFAGAAGQDLVSVREEKNERLEKLKGKISLNTLRQSMKESQAVCAAAYLGAYDPSYGELAVYLEGCGFASVFPFLQEISEDHLIEAAGMELFCIVPKDEATQLTVSDWIIDESNEFEGAAGKVLYQAAPGEPVLICCNVSDIMPNVNVTVSEETKELLSFQPFMSLENGGLALPDEGSVYDFTLYRLKTVAEYSDEPEWDGKWFFGEGEQTYSEDTSGISPEELLGFDWAAQGIYSGDGNEYDAVMTFHEDGTMEYVYGTAGNVYENRYTGTWEYFGAPETDESGDERADRKGVEENHTGSEDAETDSNLYGTVSLVLGRNEEERTGEGTDTLEGRYRIRYSEYLEDVITILLLDGDALIPEQLWAEIEYTGTVG